MKTTELLIGTRGSLLARWQADYVQSQLMDHHPTHGVDVVEIKTQGDIITDVALAALPGKAFFTKEIEDALLDGKVDLAVHSGKDVPTALPDGLRLCGFLKRHTPMDAWVSREGHTLDTIPEGARVGTSSLRRRALIAQLRPDLRIVDLRGNVDTRLAKLDNGLYDAIVLAAAGLERLSLGNRITALLDANRFPPAVSQGAMAIEIRDNDPTTQALVAPLIDPSTTAAVTAERALLRELEGGCQVPLGALARASGEEMHLFGSLLMPDGSQRIDGQVRGRTADADDIGKRLAEILFAQGGEAILAHTRTSGS